MTNKSKINSILDMVDDLQGKLLAKRDKTEEELIKRSVYHLYCDESRHLPYDGESTFLLGSLRCASEKVKDAHSQLADIWKAYGLPQHFEAKWTKVSLGKEGIRVVSRHWTSGLAPDVLSLLNCSHGETFKTSCAWRLVSHHDSWIGSPGHL